MKPTLAVLLPQLLDLATSRPAIEANPIGAALIGSGYALPAKLLLCAVVLAAASVGMRWRPALGRVVLCAGVVAGLVGAASNVVAG